jgi:pilus assembly protein CpaE
MLSAVIQRSSRGVSVQLSILLLAIDRVAADSLSAALVRPGHGVTVVTAPEELLQQAAGYSLVIIDQVPPTASVAAIIKELRAGEATSAIPVLAVAQADDLEERIALLEAGADDVITKPFDQVELEARVEALALRFQRSTREHGPSTRQSIGDPQGRRIVTVSSPKGGVGTTTIATNLALIAAERHPNDVLIVDFDLSFGQVASHLNLQPKQSLVELVRDEAALREAELFRTYTVHHAGGVHLLAAPPTPGFAQTVTGEHVELILARALEAYHVVIVDAGATLDERMHAIFSRSDTVIVPVLPEIPALNAVHLLLDQLTETGAMGATTLFVLNNTFARDLLKRADIENALGAKITADLPYDPFVYLKAVNEGVPVVRSAPKSAPANRLRDLAAIVLGTAQVGTAAPVAKERKGLFGRRR